MTYVTSAVPNPPGLTSGPNPLNAQAPVSRTNPLDYASPQSAVAAGLDPTVVNAAWAKAINAFPSAAAAVNAGVPAAVVTDMWTGGPGPVPWWKKYPMLTLAGAGALAIAILSGDKGES